MSTRSTSLSRRRERTEVEMDLAHAERLLGMSFCAGRSRVSLIFTNHERSAALEL